MTQIGLTGASLRWRPSPAGPVLPFTSRSPALTVKPGGTSTYSAERGEAMIGNRLLAQSENAAPKSSASWHIGATGARTQEFDARVAIQVAHRAGHRVQPLPASMPERRVGPITMTSTITGALRMKHPPISRGAQ